jgi:hypothetical protein
MGLQTLLLRINFGSVLMVVAKRFVFAIFIPAAMSLDNGDSYSWLSSDVD